MRSHLRSERNSACKLNKTVPTASPTGLPSVLFLWAYKNNVKKIIKTGLLSGNRGIKDVSEIVKPLKLYYHEEDYLNPFRSCTRIISIRIAGTDRVIISIIISISGGDVRYRDIGVRPRQLDRYIHS